MCALFYGDYPALARRCAQSLRALRDTGQVDMRIGLNEVSPASHAIIEATLPGVDAIHANPQIYKDPMMRRLVHEYTGDATHLMWFDDDSCLTPGLDVPRWLAAVAGAALTTQGTLGAAYLLKQSALEREWIRAQPWYTGREIPEATRFSTGGWFVVPLSTLRRFDWPPPALRHNGGDVALGALCHQQGLEVVACHGGNRRQCRRFAGQLVSPAPRLQRAAAGAGVRDIAPNCPALCRARRAPPGRAPRA